MKNLVVGISGASGTAIAAAVLERLHTMPEWNSILVMTGSAEKTANIEYAPGVEYLKSLANDVCNPFDIGECIASGSFRTEGMVIVPCSMKTLAGIVSGYSDNLLLRAADVTLKEHRQLTVVPREAPMNVIHCRNLAALAELGCTIIPPVMSFYNHPETVDDMIRHIACKILDSFHIYDNDMTRWGDGK
ncbi:putative UbiX-like flavin prenyltransferase [bioreactor metagenome]|uniref:Putative UbiX-like flavin prenyltransferase n=1 Tax=bioreactor metagenome TaxID=1076179 RepID=A0A644ZM50_9ZZZZ